MASLENNENLVTLTTTTYNQLNAVPYNATSADSTETVVTYVFAHHLAVLFSLLFSVIQNPFYDDNNEWELLSYSYEQSSVTDLIAQNKFKTLQMTINCRRNNGFYTVTLFMPILFLTLLAPIGLILPADAGEKMGLQITVMLTVVIYIDVLQGSIPGKANRTWKSLTKLP